MSTHEDFPAELVEARAKELYDEAWGAGEWEKFAHGALCNHYRAAARLSLRREVEACEPLVKALKTAEASMEDPCTGEHRYTLRKVRSVIAAHRARYAPKPETLADVAREAAEALRGNAALSARLLAAVEREKVQP